MFVLYFLAMMAAGLFLKNMFTPLGIIIWTGVTITMTALFYILETKINPDKTIYNYEEVKHGQRNDDVC